MKTRNQVVFYLNGNRHEVNPEHTHMTLSDYLRHERGLTGTKVVCAEGDCGACSVLRLFPSGTRKKNSYVTMNSCIANIAQMDGSSLVTVDSLGSNERGEDSLSPIQKAMVHCHGSQCGFCTPGFVVALTGEIEKKICQKKLLSQTEKYLSPQEAKNATTGNLCRCTGYQAIVDAAVSVDLSRCQPISDQYYSKEQEKDLKKVHSTSLLVRQEHFSMFAPKTIKEATAYLSKNKDAKMVGASTDLGVLVNKGKLKFQKTLSLHLIPQLYEIKKSGKGRVSVGARVSLSELRLFLKDLIPEMANFLDLFASPQIKNVATLIGNVGNASPIADTPPFLLVSDAVVQIVGSRGKRKIPLDQYYLGYRKTALKDGEFITSIDFSIPKKSETLALYKTSQRKDLDISIVNSAFKIVWKNEKKTEIKTITLAMGGVAATPLRLKKTETFLRGKTISPETLSQAVTILHSEMTPLSDLRGSSAYRRVLVENLFLRFFRENP